MRSVLFGNQKHNIVRRGESGSTAELDDKTFQF